MNEVIGSNSGIYQILNSSNSNCYIGKAFNIQERYKKHLTELRNNKHHNIHLQRAYNKYGEKSFKLNIIEECDKDELNDKEIYWIAYFRTHYVGKIYNIMDGGDGGKIPDNLMSEVKLKISKKAKEGTYVRHIGKENGMYGKHHSEESKQKMSDSKKGSVPWNKRKPWSNDVKLKISLGLKGKKRTAEQRKHISDGHKGLRYNLKNRVWTDEYCNEIRELHLKGYSYYYIGELLGKSDETVRKMIRNYEIKNNLPNSSDIIKNTRCITRDDKRKIYESIMII